MIWLIGTAHIIICFLLIVIVLLQKGKGQDFASTFGGGGTQTAFGARSGSTILHRATTVAAILFMVTSLTLTILMSRPGQGSVLDDGATAPIQVPAPTLPTAEPDAQAPVPGAPQTAPEGGGAPVPEDPGTGQEN
jgi:preprotein translocase subunit SecG